MAETTEIGWTDSTFNPWIGCTKVSPGCDNCYASVSTPARSMRIVWGAGQPRHRTSAQNWKTPEFWNGRNDAFKAMNGRRRRVFCASLADVFDNEVPAAWRADLFALIQQTPHLDWLLLTKRIGNAHEMIGEALIELGTRPGGGGPTSLLPSWPWRNLWLGATVVNQAEADRDIPKLLATPASVRFLSIEPMIGPIDLGAWLARQSEYGPDGQFSDRRGARGRLHWVIAGGESGPRARPAHPDWFRSLRDQCAAGGTPFHFKQHGEWIGVPDLRRLPGGGGPGFGAFDHCRFDADSEAVRVGKPVAGRLLDGVEHHAFPTVER